MESIDIFHALSNTQFLEFETKYSLFIFIMRKLLQALATSYLYLHESLNDEKYSKMYFARHCNH